MQKYAVTKGYNFLSLAGGKYYVPDLDTFYKEYADALDNHVPMYLVELKPSVYRFFIDLDYDHDDVMDFDALFCAVQEHVHALTEKSTLFILSAPVKSVDGKNKHGFHLIWPDVLVNNQHAKALRTSLLCMLYQKYANRPWDKIYDASVYNKNGLRMMGSRKSRKEAREYRYYAHMDEQHVMHKEHEYTTHELILWTVLTPASEKTLTPLSDNVFLSHEDQEGSKELGFTERVLDDTFQAIQTFIAKHFTQKMKFLDCHRTSNGFYFIRTSSKFCLNVSREHKSNTIYFFISNVSLHQRCFCRCETTEGRKYGLCKKYKSKGILLPAALKKKLFPDTQTSTESDQLVSLLNYLEAYILEKSTTTVK